MSHFAKINDEGIVETVIVAEQEFIDTMDGLWIQTSYNTHAGKHSENRTPLRKNYAGKGYKYDVGRDAFIPPQPYRSWTLDEDECVWHPPVPAKEDDVFWDESQLKWKSKLEVLNEPSKQE